MKILLSDGSGLTSRQVAARLSAAGHRVEVLSPDPICLCRWTRHVHRIHRVPAYGADPMGWLEAALDVYAGGGFDLLFPTQEQVAVLAAYPARIEAVGVRTAVPPFAALRSVQDKWSALTTLTRLGLPQPPTTVVTSALELLAWTEFPVFVKTPIGTATTGVRRVDSAAALGPWTADAARHGLLLQRPVAGPLAMAQAVFDDGRLVASHANLRVREGPRGGASHKRSIEHGAVRDQLARLGADLCWRGGLSVDVILAADGPVIIDVNPRLVEPGNAWRSGVDLVGAMAEVALGQHPPTQAPGAEGVCTHQTLMAILGRAEQGGGRRGVGRELIAALARSGPYRRSIEELTPCGGDFVAAAPVVMAAAATLAWPGTWTWFTSGSVAGYALTPEAWDEIVAAA